MAYHMECVPKYILSTVNKERGKRIWIAKGRDAEGGAVMLPMMRHRSLILSPLVRTVCGWRRDIIGTKSSRHPENS